MTIKQGDQLRLLLFSLLVVLLGQVPVAAAPTPSLAPSRQATPLQKIVALVNSQPIYSQELERELKRKPKFSSRIETSAAAKSRETAEQVRHEALEGMIDRRLLVAHAVKVNSAQDRENIKAMVGQVVAGYGGEQELAEILPSIGTDLVEFKREIAEDFAISAMLEATFVTPSKINQAELEKIFESNLDKFRSETGEVLDFARARPQLEQMLIESLKAEHRVKTIANLREKSLIEVKVTVQGG